MNTPEEKSEEARRASALAAMWLEHPFVAHFKHEEAASAQELAGNPLLAAEHRKAAEYWAKRELELNSQKYSSHPWTPN